MRNQDLVAFLDYGYWATWQVLGAAAAVPLEEFTIPTTITWRNLRGTLVHALDVEQSWRRRLSGDDKEIWDAELPAHRFRTPAELEAYWRGDAVEMRDWLADLDDATLAAPVDLGPNERFPLWFYVVHIVTHGIEQRRDAATLLTHFGHEAPQLEYLWYADSLGRDPGSR